MTQEYSKEELQRELETNGPDRINGFHRLDLRSLGIDPDFQTLSEAAKQIPEVLQYQVWDLVYGQVKFGVDSGKRDFGIIVSPTLYGRRPSSAEIHRDSTSFGRGQSEYGPNRIVEATYKLVGFEKGKEDLSVPEIRESLSAIEYVGPTENTAELSTGISFINSRGEFERALVRSEDTELGNFHLDGKIDCIEEEYGVLYGPNDFQSLQSYMLN